MDQLVPWYATFYPSQAFASKQKDGKALKNVRGQATDILADNKTKAEGTNMIRYFEKQMGIMELTNKNCQLL